MVPSIATTGQPTTLGNPGELWKNCLWRNFWNPLVISLNPGEILKFPHEKILKNGNRTYVTYQFLYPMRSYNHLMRYLFSVCYWPLTRQLVFEFCELLDLFVFLVFFEKQYFKSNVLEFFLHFHLLPKKLFSFIVPVSNFIL